MLFIFSRPSLIDNGPRWAAVIVGAFLAVPAIGTGLMFSGIFSVSDGYFNYWSELSAQLKFFSLLAAFIVLLVVGYRKLEKKETG